MKYRPEIDGLRAVAVVPVILFHAGVSQFKGGFIGVDVFFVISGYLITSIIIGELETGKFTFARFYERRARRILPALFLVMLVCIPFAWKWMMPTELKTFSNTLVSVLLFVSNLRLWHQSGYFGSASELNPLLHTWSLAVEEQFYIVLPIALLLVWRLGRNAVVLTVAAVAIMSFLLCEYASRTHPSFNFYWPITRAWELMTGSLCAFAAIRPNKRRDDALSGFGLALIVVSVFLLDKTTRFPSVYALLPVGGACLIILFGTKTTLTARVLSSTPLVGIGLISYSAYLWHQPLFAFARIRSITDLPWWMMAGLTFAVFPLAWLTWKYVETPFRKDTSIKGSQYNYVKATCATALFLALLGALGHVTSGLPSRLPQKSIYLSSFAQDVGKYSEFCLRGAMPPDETVLNSCTLGIKNSKIDFILFGDSYAAALADGVDEVARKAGEDGLLLALASCPPIFSIGGTEEDTTLKCHDFQKRLVEIAVKLNVRKVILAASWRDLDNVKLIRGFNGEAKTGYDAFKAPLLATLDEFRDNQIDVFIVCCTPSARYNVSIPESLARIHFLESGLDIRRSKVEHERAHTSALKLFKDRDVNIRAKIVDISSFFCNADKCSLTQGDVPLFHDSGHLSRSGSLRVAPHLKPIFLLPKGDVQLDP